MRWETATGRSTWLILAALAAATVGVAVTQRAGLVALLLVIAAGLYALSRNGHFWTRLGFALLCVPVLNVPSIGLPLSEVAAGALAVGAALHGQLRADRFSRLIFGCLALLPGCLVLSAALNSDVGGTALRRLGHVSIFVALAFAVASRAFANRDVATGLLSGLCLSGLVGLYERLTGVYPFDDFYSGRLTGLFGDPNVAGFFTLVLGCVALEHMNRRSQTATLIASVPLLVIVWLSFSRTTWLATAAVVIWLLVGYRLPRIIGAVAIVAGIALAFSVPADVRESGPFQGRSGSDMLRHLITKSEQQTTRAHWVIGQGPGTARAIAFGRQFFYHDSYLALLTEGGVPAVAVYGVGFLGALLSISAARRRSGLLEAGFIATAVIAVNLGEVLLELPVAVLIGAAVAEAGDRVALLRPSRAEPLHEVRLARPFANAVRS